MDPLDLLPHRLPMRLLDEIVDLRPGKSATGRRTTRTGDFFFDGHFPGEPVVPAVILVEMLAQVGGLAVAAPLDLAAAPAPARLRVAGLGPFKFPDGAGIGVDLRVTARVAGALGGLYKIEGEVTADGRLVATGSVTLGSVPTAALLIGGPTSMPGSFGRFSMAGEMRRLVHELRTERAGPGREAIAVGVGVFLGCTPFYGFHLLMCVAAGWLLRLNRLKLYLAANVSNPLLAPLLLLGEVQVGALARRGVFHSISLEGIKRVDPWSFGADLLVGSLIVGAVLGATVGLTTWLLTRSGSDDSLYAGLVRRASDRYVTTSITAWEFARGKLKGDPIYRTMVTSGLLRSGGTLVDVGCGSGLTLALLAEAAITHRSGGWPIDTPPPPIFDRLIGIELRPRAARLARRALGDAATILDADVRHSEPVSCDAVLCFDVLHMMPADDQEQVLASLARPLRANGMLLVREADAGAGWSFRAVRAGNRLKAIAFGHWRQTFHFRTTDDWSDVFAKLGFIVERRGAGEGTPFGNVLFVLTRRIADSSVGDG